MWEGAERALARQGVGRRRGDTIGCKLASTVALVGTLALGVSTANAAGPPEVTATWVTTVAATSANLRAEVNPEGLSSTYRFEFVTEAAFQASGFNGSLKAPVGGEAAIGSGSASVAVVQHIGALKANSAYRYRILAKNGSGTATGPARLLRTDEVGPVFSLPDARGWELISPVDKNGGEIQGFGGNFGGGVLQAAADGLAVTYTSASSFGTTAGAPPASQYLSRRSPSAWSTENVSLATESGAYGDHPDGVPYQLFSGDLAGALILDGRRCEQAEPCPRSYSRRENTTATVSAIPLQEPDLFLAGSTPDLAHLVFSTCAALTPDAIEVPGPEGCDPAATNLYQRSGQSLKLLNLLAGEVSGTPGASLAAQGRAISTTGSRVYFTQAGDLYLRDGAQTLPVDAGVGGGGQFQTASLEGSVAFFTREGHLYRYTVASETATDLTPGGEVMGVLGASDDGTHVYYLTSGGLFLWQGGATTPVAAQADASNYPPDSGAARISADGRQLAFIASAELIPSYDNAAQPEVYLYDAPTATLTCASCNPSGERPLGPASIPGASPNGTGPLAIHTYKPRALSANARRLFFDSFDALVPQDTNDDRDVYQWEVQGQGGCIREGGCVNLISSGRAEGGASFLDASADGSDAFFLTDGSLVPSDPGSFDVYDARVGGGFPVPPTPIPCLGDACQPLPPEPEDPTPGTLRSRPEGNPPLRFGKPKREGRAKTKHRKRHKQPRGKKRGGRR